ncbi:dihydroxyacetone kinase subunit DhaL [uncultured Desulfobacter sp.]|uniref:dihydroxyacetone kinase subunit DhaL n=1 Tax=uncultured Desulfobacter sp. TaxID=240139 RepID=UPI002AA66F14|nr:dihydroxyacetone kinase subunit DhaL [uncultured Desulfobacter sp.]
MTVSRQQIIDWLEKAADAIQDNKDHLTRLDAAIGDADHGINMVRGFKKVAEKLPTIADKDIGNILKTTGMTLISSVGGASGPLYGTFFMRAATAGSGKEALDAIDLCAMFKGGVDGIVQRGRPNLGDKTMFDAWAPALDAMQAALSKGSDTLTIVKAGAAAIEQGMKDTIPLQARKGRASYLGERSIGHQDPGATSSCLIFKMLLKVLEA